MPEPDDRNESNPAFTEAILAALPAPVLVTDADGRVRYANPAAARVLRRRPEALRGMRPGEVLRLVDDAHRPLDLEGLQARVLREAAGVRVDHATLVQGHGSEVPVLCAIAPVVGEGAEVTATVWLLQDVREERQVRHHLSLQARHDPLTGLVNRQEFERRLGHAAASAVHGGEHALCFLDLDRFKQVNDRFGHAAGDALLIDLAGLLLSRIRGRDTLARLGGDEFALLLEHCPPEEARRVAEALVEGVRTHAFAWQGQPLSVGLSVGVVAIQPHRDAGAQLEAADAACYRAKALGRDRVCGPE
jgi:diguanylate cyclase (GGDEF)-like protein/PAS domain S-box-containing protein